MKFKQPSLELELIALHPLLTQLLSGLDTYSQANGLPELTLTEVLRTLGQQEEIYWKQLQRQFNCSEEIARIKARNKDTLHFYGLAFDIRTNHYSVAQYKAVQAYLKTEMAKVSKSLRFWEFKPEPHGTGAHCHVGRRDMLFKDSYLQVHPKFPKLGVQVTTHQNGAPSI